jgi:hypothetical protein
MTMTIPDRLQPDCGLNRLQPFQEKNDGKG